MPSYGLIVLPGELCGPGHLGSPDEPDGPGLCNRRVRVESPTYPVKMDYTDCLGRTIQIDILGPGFSFPQGINWKFDQRVLCWIELTAA